MQHLKELVDKARNAIDNIEDRSLAALDEIRVEYFGKKGHFTQLMQELRNGGGRTSGNGREN
jgi:phenylalanyl-tRNA synthetase alpha chain